MTPAAAGVTLAADAVGLDPMVWGPGVVLVGLMLAGQLVPGYLWRQERDERKRLQAVIEDKVLPAIETSAKTSELALETIREAAEVIRSSRGVARQLERSTAAIEANRQALADAAAVIRREERGAG